MDERYWRIRMKKGGEQDFTREAWERNQVGIWYGAWTVDDWQVAQERPDSVQYLQKLPKQVALDWIPTKGYIDTARRFAAIREEDWVIVFYDDRLHFGRVRGE